MTQKEVPLRAVETSYKVLESLKHLEGATVSDVAERLDIPRSTVHVHLSTLTELEYATKVGDRYDVGLRYLQLGEHAKYRRNVYEAAKPQLERLADETGELAQLMVEEHGLGVHLYKALGQEAVALDTYAGKRIHLHQTGRGKAILAFLPEERVEEIIEERGLPEATPNTTTTRDRLFEELAGIRDRGYAIDTEERVEGLRCIAAPVTDQDDRALGAISVAGPTTRLQGEYFETELPETVRQVANVIELNLSYS